MKEKIRIAIIGIGNCASSLIQGINYYKNQKPKNEYGIMNWDIAGYKPFDIEVVLAYDIDKRKVGTTIRSAIFSNPNCTKKFQDQIEDNNVIVKMGCILDGVAPHMKHYPLEDTYLISEEREALQTEIVEELKNTSTEILVNYLPVGAQKATEFYMQCALIAKVGVVNCIPVFIASSKEWAEKFKANKLPIIGDDIKAQIGATIVHRTLVDLIKKRGARINKTYQLNTGGNTDFLNMLDRTRLKTKKESKSEAVKSSLGNELNDNDIHIGPSDYISWLKDNKIAFIRIDGELFGNIPFNIELKLSVEDSPNSAGVVIDAIRCCKLAIEKGVAGAMEAPSAFFMKHPPIQIDDNSAQQGVLNFLEEF